MSRGFGRVERTCLAAIEAEPDRAFTADDLCRLVYPGLNRIEKKHRVSVNRAMSSLCAATPWLASEWSCGYWSREHDRFVGPHKIWFDYRSLVARAMAWMLERSLSYRGENLEQLLATGGKFGPGSDNWKRWRVYQLVTLGEGESPECVGLKSEIEKASSDRRAIADMLAIGIRARLR